MKLYHHPVSNNCRRVLIAASLLGVDLDVEQLDLMSGANRADEFLALNANGKVPTLVDGETTLWESNAIIQYLADRSGDTPLYPKDWTLRSDIARWQFWGTAHMGPPLDTLAFERSLKSKLGMGEPDPVAIEKADAETARFLAVLDGALAGRNYLVGDALTLADVSMIGTLTYAEAAQLDLSGYPNVARWRSSIEQMEACKSHPAGLQ